MRLLQRIGACTCDESSLFAYFIRKHPFLSNSIPEPKQNKDFLVEDIDDEHALNGELLDVANLSNGEVTERLARKVARPLPWNA
jgi:hypothetical protein